MISIYYYTGDINKDDISDKPNYWLLYGLIAISVIVLFGCIV